MVISKFIQKGPKFEKFSHGSLGEHYETLLQKYGSRVALAQQVDGVEVIVTYSELLRHGKVVAGLLRQHGLGSGDTVMLCCGNTLEFAPILLGTLFIGAALAPVNPVFATADMLHLINVIKPQIVICNAQAASSVQEALTQYNTPVEFIPMEAVNKRLKENPGVEDFYLGNVDDPDTHVALVMCSSGTTGKPKGVETSHLFWILRMSIPIFQLNGEEDCQNVSLNTSGPFWISCLFNTLFTLNYGDKLFLLEIRKSFIPEEFLSVVEKQRVNNVVIGPNQLVDLSRCRTAEDFDLGSFRSVLYIGSPARNALLARAQVRLRTKIYCLYGQTECFGFTANYDKDSPLGNVGKPVPGSEIKVADVETGVPLGPHMKGEICVKMRATFKAYRGNPTATKDAFDDDGFLHSGDIGYYDEEGCFFVLDRLKETYKYNGIFVCTVDIEEVLLTHPDVVEAAVVGIYHEADCARSTAFVVCRSGAKVTEKDLVLLVQDNLPSYKWLHGGAYFLKALPRTASGKLQKFELRKFFEHAKGLNPFSQI